MPMLLHAFIPRTIRLLDSVIWNFHKNIKYFKMDRIEKILLADTDLEKKIMALRCEVTDVEAKILDNFLIERLERENRELEEEIQKYRNELIHLEKLNGRAQVNISALSHPVLSPIKYEESACPTQDTPFVGEAKKVKRESKKNDKADSKKWEKVDSKKPATDELPVDFGRLDLRVGKIISIEKHPDADSLYVEKVDIGRPEPITVVSGLVKYISASEMQNSLVVILCNLKPAKMRGITSEGMVMCASGDGAVEVLRPPFDSLPGNVITCVGYTSNPDTVMNPKKKIFETVAPDLKTDDEMVATYKGIQWTVGNKGVVKAQTLKGVNIK